LRARDRARALGEQLDRHLGHVTEGLERAEHVEQLEARKEHHAKRLRSRHRRPPSQEIAPASLYVASSSQVSPSSSSTSSVCWPKSGAGVGVGDRSSNCTGLATSVKTFPPPASTSVR